MDEFSRDDWEIIRDYKKKEKVRLSSELKRYKKHANKFERDIRDTHQQIARYERKAAALESQATASLNMRPASLQLEIDRNKGTLNVELEHLDKLKSDLELAENRQREIEPKIAPLDSEIQRIEQRIRMYRRMEHAKISAGGSHEVVVGCKKCRIADIKISNKEKTSRKYTQVVWPKNELEKPVIHVVSSSKVKSSDVITIDFDGTCGHNNNSKPGDSAEFKKSIRLQGNDNICPRVEVSCSDTDTSVKRQSGTQIAVPTHTLDKGSSSDIAYVLRTLMFGKPKEKANYDLKFLSCKGALPFDAQVIAHPAFKWKVELSCGYTQAKRDEYFEKSSDFDGVLPDGDWKVTIKGSYTINDKETPLEYKLSWHQFLETLGSEWSYVADFIKFMEPINGFLEVAKSKADFAADQCSKDTALKANILWPKVVIGGDYERVELENSPNIGGIGKLGFGFSPIIGADAELDIIQVVLQCLTGGFAGFFRKASNLSVGQKTGDGTIDKSKPYIETKLELKLGFETNVSGTLEFVCDSEANWRAINSSETVGTQSASKTGLNGLIGFKLAGAAKAEGQWLILKVSMGAEFKTVSEDASKPSGIEVDLQPVSRNNGFSGMGTFSFNGLAVVYALYKKAGGEGGSSGENGKKIFKKGRVSDKHTVEVSAKKEKTKILFKKRRLSAFGDGAYLGA